VLGDDLTFVEYLYKDLDWTNGAEAAIMAESHDNSVLLPGSGTGTLSVPSNSK
jgi:hypothetical protein